jgi:hypothetical protein
MGTLLMWFCCVMRHPRGKVKSRHLLAGMAGCLRDDIMRTLTSQDIVPAQRGFLEVVCKYTTSGAMVAGIVDALMQKGLRATSATAEVKEEAAARLNAAMTQGGDCEERAGHPQLHACVHFLKTSCTYDCPNS